MSGSTNIPGYSFKQKPIARMTAARTARVRSGIRSNVIRKIALTLVATTGSSQLWNAYRTRGGVADHTSAYAPLILPSIHAVSSPKGARIRAECRRKSVSVCEPIPPSHIRIPLSTGYSTVPPVRNPSGVIPPVTKGNRC